MLVDFKVDGSGTIRVSAGNNKTGTVQVTIERPGSEVITMYLAPSLGRALASVLMGASSEAASAQKKV